MSALSAKQSAREAAEIKVERAAALLQEAVDLLDSAKAPLELGAKVQGALDSLEEFRKR